MKNHCLNVWKGIAAFAVVLIHCTLPGVPGEIIKGIARFAVPLFFMVSGYYLRRDDMTNAQVHERMCLKVKRFGGLLLDWALFYLAWTLLRAYASDGVTGVRTALGEIFTIRHIF